MAYPYNQYKIDGVDLYAIYGVSISGGSEGFLRFPDRKDSVEHDWSDRNGIDKDLSRVFFKDRDISLDCNFIANDEQDFWSKYNAFYGMIQKPGERRLEISEFNASYFVIYVKCENFTRYTRVVGAVDKIACKMTVTFRELKPQANATNTFIISEPGIFIIT